MYHICSSYIKDIVYASANKLQVLAEASLTSQTLAEKGRGSGDTHIH